MNPKLNINMFSPGLLLLRSNICISFLLSSILIGFTISLTLMLGFTVFGQEGWAVLPTLPSLKDPTNSVLISDLRPSAPSLLAPLDSTSINITSPFFDWTDATDPNGIARYTLEISGSPHLSGGAGSSFAYPIFTINTDDSPPASELELTSPSIYDGGRYYWHVRAIDGLGNIGPYSQTFFFLVDTVVPGAPILLNPANAAIISDNTPTFLWNRTEFTLISSYELLIDTKNTFSSPVKISITQPPFSVPPTQFTPTSAFADGQFFWKVRAKDAAGNTGPYSSIRSFTIDTVPPTITASPATGTFATNQSVTLSSTATDLDAIYYTTDGSIPDNTDTKYTGPIAISSTTTLKFIGYDTLGNAGPVGTETYTIKVTLEETDTSLTLELSISVNIARGSEYTASGKLADSVTNRPISGKTITITTDGSSPVTTTTNIKGMFTAQLTAPTKPGLHSIKAQFAGDSQYKSSDSPIAKIIVKGNSPTIDKGASLDLRLEGRSTMNSDSTYTVTGKLIDALSKKPIPSKEISIETNDGSPQVTATTDKKGQFEVNLKAPSTSGEYDIKAQFAGDSQYKPTESQITKITVEGNKLENEKTSTKVDEQETDGEQETEEQETEE